MQSTVPLCAERRYYLATSPRNAMSSVFIPLDQWFLTKTLLIPNEILKIFFPNQNIRTIFTFFLLYLYQFLLLKITKKINEIGIEHFRFLLNVINCKLKNNLCTFFIETNIKLYI